MSDFGDEALAVQERHLMRSLARAGVKPRPLVIPPPHYAEAALAQPPEDAIKEGTAE